MPAVARVVPVERRVIEHGDDAFVIAGIDKFANEVPVAGGVGDVEIREAVGVVKTESFVMPGGVRDIFHPGTSGRSDKLLRIEVFRGE